MKIPYGRRSWVVQTISPAPKRHLQNIIERLGLSSGLDVGCGEGSPLTVLRSRGFRSTGIDASSESIALAQKLDLHDEYIVGDVRGLGAAAKYDVVVLSHVIEHFTRDEGLELLRRVEKLAARMVYVETPFGFLEQHHLRGNPFQRHLSGWFPEDFEERGYTVFGSAPRWLHRRRHNRRRDGGWPTRALDRTLQRWYFRHPRGAHVIAAIRLVDEDGNVCVC